jgi:hypothetical protein
MGEECRRCGEPLGAADVFCGNCGEPSAPGLSASSQHPPMAAAPVVPPPRAIRAPGQDGGGARARARPAPGTQAPGTQAHNSRAYEAPGAQATASPGTGAEQERQQELLLPYSALSGSPSLDPLFNNRFQLQILRQAALFVAVYLLGETIGAIFFGFLAIAGMGPLRALNMWTISTTLFSLALAILFWLLPVPALLAQWSLLVNHKAEAAETAFAHITAALQDHETPLDTVGVRPLRLPGEGRREYLELRQGRFAGYVSCFAHGRDLYVGWTFWLYLSPLRLLLMIIGRKIQDMSGRGNDIHQTLRYESTRATIAATHGAVLEGIDFATGDLDPAGGRLLGRDRSEFEFKFG